MAEKDFGQMLIEQERERFNKPKPVNLGIFGNPQDVAEVKLALIMAGVMLPTQTRPAPVKPQKNKRGLKLKK